MKMVLSTNDIYRWLLPVIFILFAGLTAWVLTGVNIFFDQPVLAYFAESRSPFFDQFFVLITWIGSPQVMIALSLLMIGVLAYRRYKHVAWMFAIGFYGANLINAGLKLVTGRSRPDLFPSVIDLPSSFSFPSGHTTRFTAFALCVFLLVLHYRPQWVRLSVVVLLPLVMLTALSRVYLQVHYPSDVLGSVLLALGWVLVVDWMLYKRIP